MNRNVPAGTSVLLLTAEAADSNGFEQSFTKF
jgi:hypothetical protein